MTKSFIHDVPASRVVFSNGAICQVSAEVDRLGCSRVMLISGGPEAQYASIIEQQLGDRLVARFTDVVMHVPVEVVATALALVQETGADCLVALGGGSSTGMAKAIALELGLPIVAVPTTYAGSEMTSIWGLTENNRKTTGRDLKVLPNTVIYDPELTVSLPVEISAASGMNALAHLVEALYAPGISPISFMQAQEGVRALAVALPKVVANPADLDARSDALFGAWLAGWALGTTGMGVHHKICHVLGGAYNLPHAPMHSAVLTYATAFNNDFAPAAMAAIVQAFTDAGMSVSSAADGVWQLATAIGAPVNLSSVGFDAASIDEAAQIIVDGKPINPRPVDLDGIRELLAAACVGDRPTR
jgi:maleylacetate reductase